jgi:ABC-type antimicrobial peptide transport system permease subunit
VSFALTYSRRELRRRWVRTALTALGLAAGVSLVVGIIGVSQGLDDAQTKVLSPLHSVGTDILVTRAVTTQQSTAVAGAGGVGAGAGSFCLNAGIAAAGPNAGAGPVSSSAADQKALCDENSSIVTDLSKLGKPGDKFIRDFFLPATLLTFADSTVGSVQHLDGVQSAVGGLSMLATHQTGTVPEIVAEVQTGGQQIEQTTTPPPFTAAESAATRDCIIKNLPAPSPGAKPPPDNGLGGLNSAIFQKCLPDRFKFIVNKYIVPQQTIRQVVNPPSTDIAADNYTAAGVDPQHPDEGLITQSQVVKGQYLDATATDEVLLGTTYASRKSLDVGATVPINGSDYHVVGLVTPTLTGNTADVYLPLSALQQLSSKTGRVNMVLVRASSSSSVEGVATEIRKLLPGTQVVTTQTLADQVTGSLVDAKHLADRLGTALAVIVLAGAFLIAILLTLAAVARRVREIGTLRAIGWSRAMVVRQVLLETIGISVLGGLIGVGLGLGVDAAVTHLSPTLSASNIAVVGQGTSSLASQFGALGRSVGSSRDVVTNVSISPPINATTLLAAALLGLAGGLLAGAIGGWRAARLAPAVALRDLG